jgi:hypothetical protein
VQPALSSEEQLAARNIVMPVAGITTFLGRRRGGLSTRERG